MKTLKWIGLVVLVLGLCTSQAQGQLFHGATIAKNTVSPKAPGEYLDVAIQVGYNDDYGDTIEIKGCWDVVDVDGDAVRVPAAGSLEIIAVSGNTTATVGGPLPVLIGPAGSTLNGLPGNAGDGAVVFGHDDLYVVQPDDPNPLPDQANAIVEDLCDDPETSGCSTGDNQLQFRAATDIECPEPCVGITKTVSPEFSKVGDEVTYTICVSNCGVLFDLTDVVVSDSLLGGALAGFPGTLTPGQQVCVDVPYTVQELDPDPLTNTATVTANDECDGGSITATASATLDLKGPCIDIVKTCDPQTASVGDVITYTITISNCGTAEDGLDLENVTVGDSLLGDLSASFVDTLAVGASDTQSFTRPLEATDPNPLVNVATVNATVVTLGNPVEAEDECDVTVAGEEGCTPGYWKNNADKHGASAWCDAYSPGDSFSSVFGVTITVRTGGKNTVTDPTLLQALGANGGGINALARHATAALLNACSDCVQYAMASPAQVIAAVQAEVPDGDIDGLKNEFAMYNEAGCPVNQAGECVGVEEEATE